MSKKAIQLIFFSLVTAALAAILFFIAKPYLGVLFLAGVFAVTFHPLYKKLLVYFNDRRNLAAGLTTLIIFVFIILPVIILSGLLFKEAVDLYNTVTLNQGGENFASRASELLTQLAGWLPGGILEEGINLELYAREVLDWVISHFDSIFAAVFGGALKFILMLLSLYYFLIFGDRIKSGLLLWSPLPDNYDENFLQTLRSSVDAVLRGRILVALAQGLFIGIGFAIFGVGSPVLWGFVGALTSLVPIVGTSIVIVPAVAYLFLMGNTGMGVGLLVWGAVAVGLIDNFISVLFLKNKINVHPLIVLFAVLGGVEVFGTIGFLVGPVVASAFLALMEIYPFIMFHLKQVEDKS